MKTLRKEKILADWYEDVIPRRDSLEQGKIYISKKYNTSVHLCLCGCNQETVLPLKEDGWTLTEKNGKITITPSILNKWCGSHYIITDGIANFV